MTKVNTLALDPAFRLDDSTCNHVRSLADAALQEDTTHLCLDATKVTKYEDACYWPMLAYALNIWRKRNGLKTLLAVCVPEERIETIQTTKIDSYVSLFSSVDEAMSNLDWQQEVEERQYVASPKERPPCCPTCNRAW